MESEAQSQAEDFGEALNQDVTGLVVEWLILLSLCKVFYFPEKRTQGSFRLDRRKIMRLMKHWCPEKWLMSRPWRQPNSGWTGL